MAGVGAIVTTLSGVVSWFYRQQLADQKALQDYLKGKIEKLDTEATACKKDREELRVEMSAMRAELKFFTEKLGDKCPVVGPVAPKKRSQEN